MKIGVHLLKLWPKNKVAVFWNTVYIDAIYYDVKIRYRTHFSLAVFHYMLVGFNNVSYTVAEHSGSY